MKNLSSGLFVEIFANTHGLHRKDVYSVKVVQQERKDKPLRQLLNSVAWVSNRQTKGTKKGICFLHQHPIWKDAAALYTRGCLPRHVTLPHDTRAPAVPTSVNKRQSHLSPWGKPIPASHLSYHALGPETPSRYLENAYYFLLGLILQFNFRKLHQLIMKHESIIILIMKSYQNKG